MDPTREPKAAAEVRDDAQDLVIQLLARAVQVSHAITKMQEFNAILPDGNAYAQAVITHAITVMTGVRASLTSGADTLAAHLNTRHP